MSHDFGHICYSVKGVNVMSYDYEPVCVVHDRS